MKATLSSGAVLGAWTSDFGFALAGGEKNFNAGAATNRTFDHDLALVQSDELGDDGKPKASAAVAF